MEKNRICGICSKTFASGKAMGGHMRSHYAKLPIPTRPNRTQIIDSSNSPLKSSTSSSSFSDSGSPTRSKRRHVWIATTEESPPQSVSSSVPDSLSVEEVSMCLVMLSMHKLSTEEARKLVVIKDEVEAEARMEDEKTQNYTCDKVFKSYQALGGHRAKNHQKNKKVKTCFEQDEPKYSSVAADRQEDDKFVLTSFECPFCDKVFESGKALGGHKKVHFAYLEVAHNNISSKSNDNNSLDLNVPAMEEDEGTRQKSLIRITESTPRDLLPAESELIVMQKP